MARKCKCSGPCGPQYVHSVNPDMAISEGGVQSAESTDPGVSRRDFIALAGISAAGALLSGSAVESQATRAKQAAADLATWKQSLHLPSPPRRYLSNVHTDAQMHLGGIGTGNFELGVDGQFTTWQLFNTLRDGYVPFFFGIKTAKTAKILQTAGGPDGLPRIAAIEMNGEYPIATLKYRDPDLPVEVEMSAFSPFAPLDTSISSIPAALFIFKIHNSSPLSQTVSLAGFIQNPVGYDATGVPISFNSIGFNKVAQRAEVSHPNYGGNINEIISINDATLLSMRAQPASEMVIASPLNVYTNLPAGPFNTPYEGRPVALTVSGLDRVPTARQSDTTLVWLEDAPSDIAIATLRNAVAAAKAGATLLFAGGSQPLLKHYASITNGKPLDSSSIQPDILFEDFENGYENWTVEGTAFGTAPAHGTLPGQQQVTGFLGHGLVNSFLGGDDSTGKLISKPFTVSRGFIRLLVGGGAFSTTQIRLVVDGKIVRASSGKEEERLLPTFWEVHEFAGKQAHIEIVDEQKGGWGHINVDQIEFSDMPGSSEVLALLDEILPARFTQIESGTGKLALEFQNMDLQEGAKIDKLPDGRQIVSRPLGNGKVVLYAESILASNRIDFLGARREAYKNLAKFAGIQLHGGEGVPDRAPGFGSLTLGVLTSETTHQVAFTDWQAGWNAFTAHEAPESGEATTPTPQGETRNGSLAASVVVEPGKTMEIPFFLTWSYPNKYNGGTWMGNFYSAVWPDANAAARSVIKEYKTLRSRTERFRSVFYNSTLPYWLLDCVTSQVATLRHVGVVFRIANGDVYGWEGSNGCCDPTCTHVWGYTANLARVFPEMERDMRRIDYKHQQNADGGVNNRTAVPSPPHPSGERPFTDGHCSTVLKAYREALNTPNGEWLKEYWPNIKRSVEYLIARDAATNHGVPNGLLEDDQYNTYDEALHGVTGFIGTYYLAALRAGEVMAHRMGDKVFESKCRSVFQAGQKNLIAHCWNGEYLQQDLPGYEKRGGEVGPGCMADQLIGQWWAHQLGLGYLLPKDLVRTALKSVFNYNWMPDLTGWKHSPRAFAGAKDRGLIICTWPKGGRPPNVMLYSDEVWTGIEYQVAGHMLYEGLIEEGFAITKGARDRYDGIPRTPIPRSPWNEIECGGHYARAGSSWTLLLALSGWRHDGISGETTFQPQITPGNFRSFFSGPEAWGSISQTRKGKTQKSELKVVEGAIELNRLTLRFTGTPTRVNVRAGGKQVHASVEHSADGTAVLFNQPIKVPAGQTLTVDLA